MTYRRSSYSIVAPVLVVLFFMPLCASLSGCAQGSAPPPQVVIVVPTEGTQREPEEPPPEASPPSTVVADKLSWSWASPSGAPVEVSRGVVKIGKFRFQTGKPGLSSASEPLIDVLAGFLGANPEVERLQIESHSESRGSSEFNLALTRARAHTVARALVDRGIDCKRLVPAGYGETRPIVCNDCPNPQELTRRVELVIARYNGGIVPVAEPPPSGLSDPCQPLP